MSSIKVKKNAMKQSNTHKTVKHNRKTYNKYTNTIKQTTAQNKKQIDKTIKNVGKLIGGASGSTPSATGQPPAPAPTPTPTPGTASATPVPAPTPGTASATPAPTPTPGTASATPEPAPTPTPGTASAPPASSSAPASSIQAPASSIQAPENISLEKPKSGYFNVINVKQKNMDDAIKLTNVNNINENYVKNIEDEITKTSESFDEFFAPLHEYNQTIKEQFMEYIGKMKKTNKADIKKHLGTMKNDYTTKFDNSIKKTYDENKNKLTNYIKKLSNLQSNVKKLHEKIIKNLKTHVGGAQNARNPRNRRNPATNQATSTASSTATSTTSSTATDKKKNIDYKKIKDVLSMFLNKLEKIIKSMETYNKKCEEINNTYSYFTGSEYDNDIEQKKNELDVVKTNQVVRLSTDNKYYKVIEGNSMNNLKQPIKLQLLEKKTSNSEEQYENAQETDIVHDFNDDNDKKVDDDDKNIQKIIDDGYELDFYNNSPTDTSKQTHNLSNIYKPYYTFSKKDEKYYVQNDKLNKFATERIHKDASRLETQLTPPNELQPNDFVFVNDTNTPPHPYLYYVKNIDIDNNLITLHKAPSKTNTSTPLTGGGGSSKDFEVISFSDLSPIVLQNIKKNQQVKKKKDNVDKTYVIASQHYNNKNGNIEPMDEYYIIDEELITGEHAKKWEETPDDTEFVDKMEKISKTDLALKKEDMEFISKQHLKKIKQEDDLKQHVEKEKKEQITIKYFYGANDDGAEDDIKLEKWGQDLLSDNQWMILPRENKYQGVFFYSKENDAENKITMFIKENVRGKIFTNNGYVQYLDKVEYYEIDGTNNALLSVKMMVGHILKNKGKFSSFMHKYDKWIQHTTHDNIIESMSKQILNKYVVKLKIGKERIPTNVSNLRDNISIYFTNTFTENTCMNNDAVNTLIPDMLFNDDTPILCKTFIDKIPNEAVSIEYFMDCTKSMADVYYPEVYLNKGSKEDKERNSGKATKGSMISAISNLFNPFTATNKELNEKRLTNMIDDASIIKNIDIEDYRTDWMSTTLKNLKPISDRFGFNLNNQREAFDTISAKMKTALNKWVLDIDGTKYMEKTLKKIKNDTGVDHKFKITKDGLEESINIELMHKQYQNELDSIIERGNIDSRKMHEIFDKLVNMKKSDDKHVKSDDEFYMDKNYLQVFSLFDKSVLKVLRESELIKKDIFTQKKDAEKKKAHILRMMNVYSESEEKINIQLSDVLSKNADKNSEIMIVIPYMLDDDINVDDTQTLSKIALPNKANITNWDALHKGLYYFDDSYYDNDTNDKIGNAMLSIGKIPCMIIKISLGIFLDNSNELQGYPFIRLFKEKNRTGSEYVSFPHGNIGDICVKNELDALIKLLIKGKSVIPNSYISPYSLDFEKLIEYYELNNKNIDEMRILVYQKLYNAVNAHLARKNKKKIMDKLDKNSTTDTSLRGTDTSLHGTVSSYLKSFATAGDDQLPTETRLKNRDSFAKYKTSKDYSVNTTPPSTEGTASSTGTTGTTGSTPPSTTDTTYNDGQFILIDSDDNAWYYKKTEDEFQQYDNSEKKNVADINKTNIHELSQDAYVDGRALEYESYVFFKSDNFRTQYIVKSYDKDKNEYILTDAHHTETKKYAKPDDIERVKKDSTDSFDEYGSQELHHHVDFGGGGDCFFHALLGSAFAYFGINYNVSFNDINDKNKHVQTLRKNIYDAYGEQIKKIVKNDNATYNSNKKYFLENNSNVVRYLNYLYPGPGSGHRNLEVDDDTQKLINALEHMTNDLHSNGPTKSIDDGNINDISIYNMSVWATNDIINNQDTILSDTLRNTIIKIINDKTSLNLKVDETKAKHFMIELYTNERFSTSDRQCGESECTKNNIDKRIILSINNTTSDGGKTGLHFTSLFDKNMEQYDGTEKNTKDIFENNKNNNVNNFTDLQNHITDTWQNHDKQNKTGGFFEFNRSDKEIKEEHENDEKIITTYRNDMQKILIDLNVKYEKNQKKIADLRSWIVFWKSIKP